MADLPSLVDDGSFTIMKATLLLREKRILPGNDAVMEIVIWQLPRMLPGSRHHFKYRLALVVGGDCVLRYDNEAGKGDHKHIGEREVAYDFTDMDALLRDFRADVVAWRIK